MVLGGRQISGRARLIAVKRTLGYGLGAQLRGLHVAPPSLAQSLRNAIDAEYAASRFYQLLAESTTDPEARTFLDSMVAAEIEHARAIEHHAALLAQEGLPELSDSNTEVIETVPNWKFVDDISYEAALDVARAAEIQASLYYDAIADSLTGIAETFFRELSRAEDQHSKMIDERRARRL